MKVLCHWMLSWAKGASPSREMGEAGEKGLDNDAEGIWSPDIEQSRNELIARYIKLRTGKTRTRKQVSSHIQVLARRKTREIQAKLKDEMAKDQELQSMAAMTSAQLASATVFEEEQDLSELQDPSSTSTQSTDLFHFWVGDVNQDQTTPELSHHHREELLSAQRNYLLAKESYWYRNTWTGGVYCFYGMAERTKYGKIGAHSKRQHHFVYIGPIPICGSPLEMVDMRQIYDKFPEEGGGLQDLYDQGPPQAFFLVKFWADLNLSLQREESGGIGGAFYGVSSRYEGPRALTLSCTSKVCSFGKQVVEKLETAEPAHWENDRFVFHIKRSPLCEYLINFIRKLRTLPEKQMMDSVLENFSILQILRDQETQELLLCVAFVFEVSAKEQGSQHHIYRLGRD
ncbi:hypothetical protein E2320_003104 [Naja naja]|nr:hypothetical protein E2320_003104 [Naja naja]